ncbi:MAG: anaerobic ribonucleoside-triphosphate reductase activating protein [Deltaproteobacteria bacterium]|nr:anaerobic ribonucleoside-triphosphate reductase activating protein [Deltaproteobacteria bacterium]MCK5514780.1 anaerobic ribonucleoside-triphosphate reductase activating protein [Deltaproteobacteria bacterium]
MSFPIKGFLETSFVDWPGKVASVIFLSHCNFRCPYCHNYDLVLHPDQLPTIPFEQVIQQIKKYKGWVDGVCITGGEPTLFPALVQLIEQLRNEHMLIKLDTNGSRPEVLKKLIDNHLVEHVAMDVKAPLNQESYSNCCGVSVDLEKIKGSIDLLRKTFISYEFRVTAVPTLLKKEDLLTLANELKGSEKLTLQNFNPEHPLDPGLKNIKPYTDQEIEEMQEEMNQILKGSNKPEGSAFFYSKPATRNL